MLRIFGKSRVNTGINKFGIPPNYSEFEASGFLAAYGSARGWIDYNFGIGALSRGAAAPDLVNLASSNIEVLGFNGVNVTEQVSTTIEMNHNWVNESIIYPHVHWMPTTTGLGNVNWQLEYIATNRNVAGASVTINVIQATGGVAWNENFASLPAIDMTGFTVGTQLFFRLFRDPTDDDTYEADAVLATFGVHVLLNTIGSREMLIK